MNSKLTLIVNGINGDFLIMDKKARELYSQISENKNPKLSYKDADLDLQELKNHEIVIDDDVDELQYIKVMNRKMMFQTNRVIVTVAPTLDCNFRCSYCYENRSKNKMTADVLDKTVRFINQRLKSATSLHIAWYGGEPLLEKKTIRKMSEQLMSSCKRYRVRYSAGIVTNGYLLNKKTALELREYKVSNVQVTIDGPKYIHDKRRILANGKGTFDTIIQNLTDVVDIIPLVKIRVNVDKNNAGSIVELLDTLNDHGLKDKIKIYCAAVSTDNVLCQDLTEETMADEEYLTVETSLYKTILGSGFELLKHPRTNLGGCGAMHINSFLIDPTGDIYKCWRTIGNKEQRIGTVNQPLKYNMNHLKWLSWDPLLYSKCKCCKFLPLCMGGCPQQTIYNNLTEPACEGWQKNTKEMLCLYYKSYFHRKLENKLNGI